MSEVNYCPERFYPPSQVPSLAQSVPTSQRSQIETTPIYSQMGSYSGSPSQIANEGLAFSIGDPDASSYVTKVANSLNNPKLRDQLIRLHLNEIANRKSNARSDFY